MAAPLPDQHPNKLRTSKRRLTEQLRRLEQERAKQEKRIRELEKENERLRRELEKVKTNARRSSRQSGRFSKDNKKANPKKPGRKPGHTGAFRPTPEHVDETIDVPLDRCPDCGGPLSDCQVRDLFQTDIPEPIIPKVTKFRVASGYCGSCEKQVAARHPSQMAQPNEVVKAVLGPNVVALLAYLKDGLGMPFRKISSLLFMFFGIEVTPGGISQALDRVAVMLKGTYDILITEVQASEIMHVDETGWRINGDTAWLWVFTNEKLTVYTIRRSRGADVLRDVLGDEFGGILVSDCLNTYQSYDAEKAKCMAHLIKDLVKLQEEKVGMAARFSREALEVCRDAIALKKMKSEMPDEVYDVAVMGIFDRMVAAFSRKLTDPDNARLARRIDKYMEEFLNFLFHDNLDPTNNLAERQLRPAVITRKISCGSRSDGGAKRHSIIASVLETCRQQGQDFIAVVAQAMLSLGESVDLFVLDTT